MRLLQCLFHVACCCAGLMAFVGCGVLDLSGDERVALKLVGHLEPEGLRECSGLVRSRTHEGVFWAHNDSGNRGELFAVRRDGRNAAGGLMRVRGVSVVDWEDIGLNARGELVIGDFGDNKLRRREYALLFIAEPDPATGGEVRGVRVLRYTYPQGTPYNAEALFCSEDWVYVLTKSKEEALSRVFRVRETGQEGVVEAEWVRDLAIAGAVTGADISADGRRVAVLTYEALWVFERQTATGDWFDGKVRCLPLRAGQCEAVAFEDAQGEALLVANEGREVFAVRLSEIPLWNR